MRECTWCCPVIFGHVKRANSLLRPLLFPQRWAFPSCSCFQVHWLIIVYAVLSRRPPCRKNILHSGPFTVHSFLTQAPTTLMKLLGDWCVLLNVGGWTTWRCGTWLQLRKKFWASETWTSFYYCILITSCPRGISPFFLRAAPSFAHTGYCQYSPEHGYCCLEAVPSILNPYQKMHNNLKRFENRLIPSHMLEFPLLKHTAVHKLQMMRTSS